MEFSETCCAQEDRFLWFIAWRISTGCCSYGCSAVLRFGYFDSSCELYLRLSCLGCVRQLLIHWITSQFLVILVFVPCKWIFFFKIEK